MKFLSQRYGGESMEGEIKALWAVCGKLDRGISMCGRGGTVEVHYRAHSVAPKY